MYAAKVNKKRENKARTEALHNKIPQSPLKMLEIKQRIKEQLRFKPVAIKTKIMNKFEPP